jgi:hypothetical protein
MAVGKYENGTWMKRRKTSLNTKSRNAVVTEGIHLTNVTRACSNDKKPKILFFAEWTRRMGFVENALIQLLPEEGGVSFVLCNENIASYSELLKETREKGGTLIHTTKFMHREYPCIQVSGAPLKNSGLKYGDNLIGLYKYGLIRMRKLPDDGSRVVNARVYGNWLEDLGFLPGEVLTVDSEPGLITCALQENGKERTEELVKHARENRLNLLQVKSVSDNNWVPMFAVPTSRMEKAGFLPEEVLHATCDYGCIKLQKLDFVRLGF